MSRADNIIRSFVTAFDAAQNAQAAIKDAAFQAALYISSCGQAAIDSLSAASNEKLDKRILPAIARYAVASYSLEFSDSGAAKLIALRDVDSERQITTWAAMPVFHCADMERGFKPVFRLPVKHWTWEECRKEFTAILEKRGLAQYAAALDRIAADIDAI